MLVALLDPRAATIIGCKVVDRSPERSPFTATWRTVSRGASHAGCKCHRAPVDWCPPHWWLLCPRANDRLRRLSGIRRNPCTGKYTAALRESRARALPLSLSLFLSLCVGRSRPLARHADATVPDLQLTRDAARRVCASLAPAHRILTPLRSWHPRSVSHPPSLPSCLLHSSYQRRKEKETERCLSFRAFFLPSSILAPTFARASSTLVRAPRRTTSISTSSLSLSARSPGPPLFLHFPSPLPPKFVSSYRWSSSLSLSSRFAALPVAPPTILSRFTYVPLPWTHEGDGSSSLFGSFSPPSSPHPPFAAASSLARRVFVRSFLFKLARILSPAVSQTLKSFLGNWIESHPRGVTLQRVLFLFLQSYQTLVPRVVRRPPPPSPPPPCLSVARFNPSSSSPTRLFVPPSATSAIRLRLLCRLRPSRGSPPSRLWISFPFNRPSSPSRSTAPTATDCLAVKRQFIC